MSNKIGELMEEFTKSQYRTIDIEDEEKLKRYPLKTQIFAYKLAYPGWSAKKISDTLGCTYYTVIKNLSSEDGRLLWQDIDKRMNEHLFSIRAHAMEVLEEFLHPEVRPDLRLQAAKFIAKKDFDTEAGMIEENKEVTFVTTVNERGALEQTKSNEDIVVDAEVVGSEEDL